MTKQQILDEIRRTAQANGGVPLGQRRFAEETGIRFYDWFGKHWPKWSDAIRQAGYTPQTLKDSFSDDVLLEKLATLIRDLGHFPGKGDLRLKKRTDPTFPNDKVIDSHFGSRARQRQVIIEYCRTHPGFDDIPPLCGPISSNSDEQPRIAKTAPEVMVGFVYLMKHGRHYKIGKTNAPGRREYELAIQLPEKLRRIHVIKTDDPDGIEEYWHKRFAMKRGNGEWFELEPADVQAFCRRNSM